MFNTLKRFLYPENIYCACCSDAMEGSRIHGICDSCAEKISWTLDNPFELHMDDFAFDDVFVCCVYGYYPRKIIYKLKFGGANYIARGLGLLMAERLCLENLKADIITEVPMFALKEKRRGYNQAALLAESVSAGCGIPYTKGLLVKIKDTASSRESGAFDRHIILDKALSLDPKYDKIIKGKHIIVVDDVITTGSTADASAKALKDAGAERVSILCFAAASALYVYTR